jgi:hypothetical protein
VLHRSIIPLSRDFGTAFGFVGTQRVDGKDAIPSAYLIGD